MLQPFIMSGVNEDLPPWVVSPELWTGATGVNFRDGVTTRVLGTSALYGAATAAPVHLLNSDFDGSNYWLYGCDGEINVIRSSDDTHFDITPAAWPSSATPDLWTSTLLNGVPVMNYEGVTPVWWDRITSNVMTDLPDWPTGGYCYSMRSFKDFLMAIGYSDASNSYPDQLLWSDAADPGLLPAGTDAWNPSGTSLSGTLEFGDTRGGLVDGAPLRGNFILYKQGSTYLVQYVGGTFIFGKRKLFNTSGVLARNCIAEVEGNHVVFTDSDVIIHDGQQAKSLVDSRVRRQLFSALDTTHYRNSYVYHHKSREEVWICYPEAGQEYANKALVWDSKADKLSFRDLQGDGEGYAHVSYGNISSQGIARPYSSATYPYSSATFSYGSGRSDVAIFNGLAASATEEAFHSIDTAETSVNGSIQAVLRRDSLDFGDATRVKTITEIWPQIEGADGDIVQIRAGYQMKTEEPITWSQTTSFIIGTDRKADIIVSGKYISLEFSTTDGSSFKLPKFDVKVGNGTARY